MVNEEQTRDRLDALAREAAEHGIESSTIDRIRSAALLEHEADTRQGIDYHWFQACQRWASQHFAKDQWGRTVWRRRQAERAPSILRRIGQWLSPDRP